MQTAIKTLFMRGGTSRGPFFNEADLPTDIATRDRVLLAALGSPDKRQIDGLGGAHPLTSKVGIVRPSTTPGVDLDFLFAQLQPDKETVDTTPNCGNMLAAVVPFALETGMVAAQGETTTLRVLTLNTDMQCDITVSTPGGHVAYDGEARIDGVPGTSAPITINFLDTAGSVCSGLLPTGHVVDMIDGIEVTCIDNGMPLVIFRAADVGCTGYESVAELNGDLELKARIERLRCPTASRRQHCHPQLHPACLPRRDRRAGRGDGGHGLRTGRLGGGRRGTTGRGQSETGVGRAPDRRILGRARARSGRSPEGHPRRAAAHGAPDHARRSHGAGRRLAGPAGPLNTQSK